MQVDVLVYNGARKQWLTSAPHPALFERAMRLPEWVLFRCGNQTYYRTFENHIYSIRKVKHR